MVVDDVSVPERSDAHRERNAHGRSVRAQPALTSAQRVIRWLAWALTSISFLGSWSHCYDRVLAAGQDARLSLIIATLPEVSVLVALLAWLSGEHTPWTVLTGSSAFAFTITANWQTAQSGIWSHVVAVWPAWSAITALMLTHRPSTQQSGIEPVLIHETSAQPALTGTDQGLSAERAAAHRRAQRERRAQASAHPGERAAQAVSAPVSAPLTLVSAERAHPNDIKDAEQRIAWLRDNPTGSQDVMRIFGVSAPTARRYLLRAKNQ